MRPFASEPRSSLLLGFLLVAAAGATAGCDETELDTSSLEAAPSAVLEGTAVYIGPPPECVEEPSGGRRVQGFYVLLLFDADNPPPPAGTGGVPVSFLVVPAERLFNLEDCGRSPGDRLTRSTSFEWAPIPLADTAGASRRYRIAALFDRNEDFLPFYSVRSNVSSGDLLGSALRDPTAPSPQPEVIEVGNVVEQPGGQRVVGLTVTVALPVTTEPPAFRLGPSTRALSSRALVPTVPDEMALWELASASLELLDPEDPAVAATLLAAGVSIDPDPRRYGWFLFPVDLDGDGIADPHPVFGSAGLPWYFPLVFLQRARTWAEQRAGLPNVAFVGSMRPLLPLLGKRTLHPTMDIVIAPVAVVDLKPGDPSCQVPIVPPGNLASLYETRPSDCQPLPSGNYDVTVLGGLAGAEPIDYLAQLREANPMWSDEQVAMAAARVTDSGWVLDGGTFAAQRWTVPNELGCTDPVYRPLLGDRGIPPRAISQIAEDRDARCEAPYDLDACDPAGTPMSCDQGPAGRFSVVDPERDVALDPLDTSDGHGVAACQQAPRTAGGTPEPVTYAPVPEACCESVRHLCGLPLCPARANAARASADGARWVREARVLGEDFTVDEDGQVTLLCVPFLPPASCCR